MSKISQEGTYRGSIVDHGISESKNGAADLVIDFVATEEWNPDINGWEDCSQYEDNEITGHFYRLLEEK